MAEYLKKEQEAAALMFFGDLSRKLSGDCYAVTCECSSTEVAHGSVGYAQQDVMSPQKSTTLCYIL